MSNQAEYDAILTLAQKITQDELKKLHIPAGIYAQEAEDLYVWSAKDKEALIAAGIPEDTFEKLNQAAGAFRHAQSLWNRDLRSRQDAEERWATESPKAFDLVAQLLHTFRYAYRNNPALQSNLAAIAEGDGIADMIQDLSDLAVLGKSNPEGLISINFEMTLLDEAANTSSAMADLRALANGDKAETNEMLLIRNQMYTLLNGYVDEIRNCGKYLFWRNPDRLKGYTSQYLRAKKKKSDKVEESYS